MTAPSLPSDLLRIYSRELEGRQDTQGILGYVDEALESLLRRKGDVQFLGAVKAAVADGVAGRWIEDQRRLALDALALVLAKRPVIAQAWHTLEPGQGSPPSPRRASDFTPSTLVAAVNGLPKSPPRPEVTAAAEELLERYFVGALADMTQVIEMLGSATPEAPDARHLLAVLNQGLERQDNEDAIIAFVGQVLELSLRRKGDAEFLIAVRSALVSGLGGRSLGGQRALAREVFALVLAKRPEVAAAWKTLQGNSDACAAGRRFTDNAVAVVAETEDAPSVTEESPPKRYRYADVEALVAADFAAELARRAFALQISLPPAPSSTYCREQPFFLFSPVFGEALKAFAAGPLIISFRKTLERHVYRFAKRRKIATPAQRDAFLGEKRDEVWQMVGNRLGKLAMHHAHALAKLQKAQEVPLEEAGTRRFQTVKTSVKVPRVYRVLGIEFQLGTETVITSAKVPVKLATDLEPVEEQALELIRTFCAICQDHGVALPPAAKCFEFIHSLFQLDTKKFSLSLREFVSISSNKQAIQKFVAERMRQMDAKGQSFIGDAFILSLFTANAERSFGFGDLCEACSSKAGELNQRPFATAEIERRPGELLSQLADLLAKRSKEESIAAAALMLLSVWRVLAKWNLDKLKADVLEGLQRLPGVFAGQPDQSLAREICEALSRAFADPELGTLRASEKNDQAFVQRIRKIVSAARKR